jgi:hypothetical protein
MFDTYSISCSANVNVIFEFFPYTPQLRLNEVGYDLRYSLSKGVWDRWLVRSEVWVPKNGSSS